MSRVTLTLRYPAVTPPALRRALVASVRVVPILVAGGVASALVLRSSGLAPGGEDFGLLPLAAVPGGLWLGCLARGLAWLLVGQGVGLRLSSLSLGAGPFVTTLVRPRRVIVIRLFPISIRPGLVATRRPMLRLQYWLTAVWAVLAMGGTGLMLWSWAPAPWGHTAAAGTALSLVVALWPYAHGVTDLWILGRLPFLGAHEVGKLVTDEDVLELEVAEEACDLARARAALGRLEARGHAESRLCHWRSSLLEMEGRYADAVREQRRELALGSTPAARPWQLMSLADLLLAAGDARQLPVFEWRPAAEAALAEISPVLPHARVAGTRAYYCVLTGDYEPAARLARTAIRSANSRLEAAAGWCVLAVARAGSWDPAGAAEALGKARALAPGWPRVDHADERVHLLMPQPL